MLETSWYLTTGRTPLPGVAPLCAHNNGGYVCVHQYSTNGLIGASEYLLSYRPSMDDLDAVIDNRHIRPIPLDPTHHVFQHVLGMTG